VHEFFPPKHFVIDSHHLNIVSDRTNSAHDWISRSIEWSGPPMKYYLLSGGGSLIARLWANSPGVCPDGDDSMR
jgi:hypothetical protein